jgi:hypothetical protein
VVVVFQLIKKTMNEGFPVPEQNERVDKEKVIESLKADASDTSLLVKFMESREAEVTNSQEGLRLNVELAEIYRDAGLIEMAREAFADAALQAVNEGDDETARMCDAEYEKLQS